MMAVAIKRSENVGSSAGSHQWNSRLGRLFHSGCNSGTAVLGWLFHQGLGQDYSLCRVGIPIRLRGMFISSIFYRLVHPSCHGGSIFLS